MTHCTRNTRDLLYGVAGILGLLCVMAGGAFLFAAFFDDSGVFFTILHSLSGVILVLFGASLGNRIMAVKQEYHDDD